MAETARKRRRLICEIAATGVAKKTLAQLLSSLGDEETRAARTQRADVADAVSEHARANTPYGTVVKQLEITDGFTLPYICPFALLFYLCTVSSEFAELVQRSVATSGGDGRLIMYADEVRPGNVLRPDKGRTT
eukprot:13584191-Alexandrium_andersonii.AAC.1